MVRKTCCICKNVNNCLKGIVLHCFPADKSVKNKWIEILQKNGHTLTSNHGNLVCSEHFSPSQLLPLRGRLKSEAVPDVFSLSQNSTPKRSQRIIMQQKDAEVQPIQNFVAVEISSEINKMDIGDPEIQSKELICNNEHETVNKKRKLLEIPADPLTISTIKEQTTEEDEEESIIIVSDEEQDVQDPLEIEKVAECVQVTNLPSNTIRSTIKLRRQEVHYHLNTTDNFETVINNWKINCKNKYLDQYFITDDGKKIPMNNDVFMKLCLVCAKSEGTISLCVRDTKTNLTLAEQIQSFVCIKVEHILPKFVCFDCSKKINMCYKFKNECYSSINMFTGISQLLDQTNNCDEVSTFENDPLAHNKADTGKRKNNIINKVQTDTLEPCTESQNKNDNPVKILNQPKRRCKITIRKDLLKPLNVVLSPRILNNKNIVLSKKNLEEPTSGVIRTSPYSLRIDNVQTISDMKSFSGQFNKPILNPDKKENNEITSVFLPIPDMDIDFQNNIELNDNSNMPIKDKDIEIFEIETDSNSKMNDNILETAHTINNQFCSVFLPSADVNFNEDNKLQRIKNNSEDFDNIISPNIIELPDNDSNKTNKKIKTNKTPKFKWSKSLLFYCNICSKIMPTVTGLQEHIRNEHHNTKKRIYWQCRDCNITFADRAYYGKHMRIHC